MSHYPPFQSILQPDLLFACALTNHFLFSVAEFSYGSPFVGGAGAGQPPRMPLVTGQSLPGIIPGPNQSIAGTPNVSFPLNLDKVFS